MSVFEQLQTRLNALYRTDPVIHITVSFSRPKAEMRDQPVRIVGVYKNLFRVQDITVDYPKFYSYQYVDVLTGNVKIRELAEKKQTSL